MFKFKKRAKEDRIKHMELKENRPEDVGVSALGLKGRKTGDDDGNAGN